MPAPGPNYPSPSTVRRHSHQAKLEAMFGLIEVSMQKHSVLLTEVVSGLGTIATNTKEKEDDREELDRLRRQHENQQTPDTTPTTIPKKPKKTKEEDKDTNFLPHILGGLLAGGLTGTITAIAGKLASGLLVTALAGPASQFIADAIGGVFENLTGNESLGEGIRSAIQPNLETGFFVGLLNKRLGLIYTIVGSALDGITDAIGSDRLNLFGFDIDMNSGYMKAILSGAAMTLFNRTARNLIKSVGVRLMGSLLGPVGLVATIGSIAWSVIDGHNKQWISELADKAKEDLEDGLENVRNERKRTMWENLTFGGPDMPVRDSLSKLNRLGEVMNRETGGNDDNSRFWDSETQTAMVPAIDATQLDEGRMEDYNMTRDMLEDLLEDEKLGETPLDVLRQILHLTNRFGVENSKVRDMVTQLTELRAPDNTVYSEIVPAPVTTEEPRSNRLTPQFFSHTDPSDDYSAVFDKIQSALVTGEENMQDNMYTSMARVPKELWDNGVSQHEKAAMESMSGLGGSMFNFTPIVNSNSNPVIRQGDTITQTTNIFNGRDASDDLRPHMNGY